MTDAQGLAADHRAIADDLVARAYFLQLRRIAGALAPALAEMVRDRLFSGTDVQVIDGYLRALLGDLSAAVQQLVSRDLDRAAVHAGPVLARAAH